MLLAVLVLRLNYARIMLVLKNYASFLNYASRKYATKAKKSTYFLRKSEFVTLNRHVFSTELFQFNLIFRHVCTLC